MVNNEAVVTGSLKTRDAKIERTIKTGHHQKHSKFARHWRGRDPVVTAAISKKRHKTKTAVSDAGWTRFQR